MTFSQLSPSLLFKLPVSVYVEVHNTADKDLWVIELAETTGDVTRDDWQRRFLAQNSVKMLEQCCNYCKQCCCDALKIVVANRPV